MRSTFGNGNDVLYGQLTIVALPSTLLPALVVGSPGAGVSGYAQITGLMNLGTSGGDYPCAGYNWRPDGGVGSAYYVVNDFASRIRFGGGGLQLEVAPSGVAGNNIGFYNAVAVSLTGVLINAPLNVGTALSVIARSNNFGLQVLGSGVLGGSFGVVIAAGTSSSDYAMLVQNAAGTGTFFQIFGNGNIGFNGVAFGASLVSGWGAPGGAAPVANFPGGSATLAQCSTAIAKIIVDLKALGFYGA